MASPSERPVVGLLWIVPSDDDFAQKRITADHHLGCAYLAAYLEREGIRTKQYVVRSLDVADVARKIVADGIRVLGLSVKDTNYYAARWIASAVKELTTSIFIVVGGLTATFSDDLVLKHCPDVDACLRGYAETSLLDLVRAVVDGSDLDAVPALTRRVEGKVARTSERRREGTGDLDFFPSPYLSGLLPATQGPKVGLSTSRGCVFRCTFCNPTAMAGYQIAYHSDERVLAELHYISDGVAGTGGTPPHMLFLNEDIFALNLKRTRRLCERIATDRPKNLVFGCETRIEHLDEETLNVMYAAGFRFLKFGLESGNPRVLNIIKKVRAADGAEDGYSAEREFLERLLAVVLTAKRIGFRVVAGAIFGLPGEQLPDAIETLDFLLRLDVDEYYHNYLQLFPGTEAFATYRRWGYQLKIREDFYPTIYQTIWPYPVQLVPRLEGKLNREFRRNVVHL